MSKQTVLATGATGLVGSRFVELYQSEYEVANMDLTTGVDITDPDSIGQFVKEYSAGVLIHLAAFTNTNAAFEQTGDKSGLCYKVNVEGTRNIVEACRQHDLHLLHVSTDFVFDGTKDSAYTEDDSRSPLEWYGETKAMAEEVVENSGISYTIVRIAYPYRREFADKPDLIKKIRNGLETGQLYPQFTDTTITPTFIDDIARGFAKVVKDRPQGTYHFTGNTSLSPYQLACQVAIAYGFDPSQVKEGSLSEYQKTAARPFARHVAMENSKARNELGLTFATLAEGLAAVA